LTGKIIRGYVLGSLYQGTKISRRGNDETGMDRLYSCRRLYGDHCRPVARLQPVTDILDGGVPGVGTFFTEYIQAYQSDEFKDKDGNDIPGQPDIGTLVSLNQLVHVYKHKLLGAHIGVDVLLPIVSISGNGIPANPDYLGDLTVGPFLQWLDTKLLGRPYVHRFGAVRQAVCPEPGEQPLGDRAILRLHLVSYAQIFHLLADPLHHQHGERRCLSLAVQRLLQVFHFNYSFEYEFLKGFRGGIAGYYLKQLTEDEGSSGDIPDSEEQVFAFGPAIHYFFSDKFSAGLKTAWETSTENRTEGNRTTLRFTYLF
jgi:hypothetical protein